MNEKLTQFAANGAGRRKTVNDLLDKVKDALIQARSDGATPKQIELLAKLGVSPSTAAGYGRRQASAVIESLKAKRCTTGQRWRLKKIGYADVEIDGMNFDAASKAIDDAMQGART